MDVPGDVKFEAEKLRKFQREIAESGAVFTYGRSHLTISGDGHDNNYFFIKRDPIRKLICGRSQSAVICGKKNWKIFVN